VKKDRKQKGDNAYRKRETTVGSIKEDHSKKRLSLHLTYREREDPVGGMCKNAAATPQKEK